LSALSSHVPICFMLPCWSLLLAWISEEKSICGSTTSHPSSQSNYNNTSRSINASLDQVPERGIKRPSASSREVDMLLLHVKTIWNRTAVQICFWSFDFPCCFVQPKRLPGAIFSSFCSAVWFYKEFFYGLYYFVIAVLSTHGYHEARCSPVVL
jgi:hypothetical protein